MFLTQKLKQKTSKIEKKQKGSALAFSLIIIAMILIVFGVQPMLQDDTRKNSVAVINSVTMTVAGVFLMFYWNSIVP